MDCAAIDHDELVRGNVDRALRFLPAPSADASVVYRGWMVLAEAYAGMTEALRARGYVPLTSEDAYRTCHHLPENYQLIKAATPDTTWLTLNVALPNGLPNWAAIRATASQLGPGPCIVKDWVKSQKHAWKTACYIPSAVDGDVVQQITSRFLELQGEQLVGGLVFRKFVPLRLSGLHPRSGMPLGVEIRSFWVNGTPIAITDYWAEAAVGAKPDLGPFMGIGRSVPSPFFTMDLAQAEDGHWFIMELGDGQVAGLPDGLPPSDLLRALRASGSSSS
jgi:hypothetical protein